MSVGTEFLPIEFFTEHFQRAMEIIISDVRYILHRRAINAANNALHAKTVTELAGRRACQTRQLDADRDPIRSMEAELSSRKS